MSRGRAFLLSFTPTGWLAGWLDDTDPTFTLSFSRYQGFLFFAGCSLPSCNFNTVLVFATSHPSPPANRRRDIAADAVDTNSPFTHAAIMAFGTYSSSEGNEINLMQSFQKGAKGKSQQTKQRSCSPGDSIQDEASTDQQINSGRLGHERRRLVGIRVSPVRDREEYIYYDGEDAVHRVHKEVSKGGTVSYDVTLVNGRNRRVS